MSSLQWLAVLNAPGESGERPSLIMQFAVPRSAKCSVRLRDAPEPNEQFAVACSAECWGRLREAPEPNKQLSLIHI